MKLTLYISLIFFSVVAQSGDLKKVMDLSGLWKFTVGDNPSWADPSYDDRSWDQVYVPSPWEDEGFSGFDGFGWYRIAFSLESTTEENLVLVLGYIDDVDQVYFNGHLIGFSGSFPPHFYTAYQSYRKYRIPKEYLKKNGKNVIAVRVYDAVLEGGIIKGDVGLYSYPKVPENILFLDGIWKFREGDMDEWKAAEYRDNQWRDILVPSHWKSLKKWHPRKSTAWYRTSFKIPEKLRNEKLVLVLGKIDDFDEAYLNGELIGMTNDGMRYGASNSWQQFRIYIIPKSLIKNDGINQLAVRVIDLGGDAGIYEGPLAIVPFGDYWNLIEKFR